MHFACFVLTVPTTEQEQQSTDMMEGVVGWLTFMYCMWCLCTLCRAALWLALFTNYNAGFWFPGWPFQTVLQPKLCKWKSVSLYHAQMHLNSCVVSVEKWVLLHHFGAIWPVQSVYHPWCVCVCLCVCVCAHVCVCLCVCVCAYVMQSAEKKKTYLEDVQVPLKRFSDYLKDKKWVAGDTVGLTVAAHQSCVVLCALRILSMNSLVFHS